MQHARPVLLLTGALSTLAGLVASGCAPSDSTTPTAPISSEAKEAYLKQSGELASELQGSLAKRLMAAMEDGGPTEAVEVCQEVAQRLTEKSARMEPPAEITRTALRVRNPVNRPDEHSAQVMQSWESTLAKGNEAKPDIRINDGSVIVHRPIMTAELCLQCHGEPSEMKASTRSLIREYYPDDAATGFQAGDLRGAFRIEFGRQPD